MIWWAWKPVPLHMWVRQNTYIVYAMDRDPGQWRRPVFIGVYSFVKSREEARELARGLNHKVGVPVGWPEPKPRGGW
jgi:hypothetical protein